MKHARILLAIGLWMALIPFTGIPFRWHQTLFLVSGILVSAWAFREYTNLKRTGAPTKEKRTLPEEKGSEPEPAPESLQPRLITDEPKTKPDPEPVSTTKRVDTPKEVRPAKTFTPPAIPDLTKTEPKPQAEPKKKEAANPSRKLLGLAAMMLGYQIQKEREVERTTPRIRITKPTVRAEDIPVVTDEFEDEEPTETVVHEDEELELLVDEELDDELAELPEEVAAPEPDQSLEDWEEEEEVLEVIDDELETDEPMTPDYAEEDNDKDEEVDSVDENEKETEEDDSAVFAKRSEFTLGSSLLARLSDDFDEEELDDEDDTAA